MSEKNASAHTHVDPSVKCECKPKESAQLWGTCICGVCGHLDDNKTDDGYCSRCDSDCWVQRGDICNPDLHDYVWTALHQMAKRLDKIETKRKLKVKMLVKYKD